MSTLARLEAVTERRAEAEKGWVRLVRRARDEGHSLRAIAAAAGVSHVAVARLLRSKRGGPA